jgi:AcrR family transcriptional regulator
MERDGTLPGMVKIANEAGVTRTAVYYYFPGGRGDLVRAVMSQMHFDWWSRIIAESEDEPSLWNRINLLLVECRAQALSPDASNFFALAHGAKDHPEVREALRDQARVMRTAIRGLATQHPGDLRSSGRTAEEFADAILGLIWCVASGVINAEQDSILRQVDQAIELVCALPGTASSS